MHIHKDYSKEFEEKKSELQAKVIEIYEASDDEIKEKKEGALKKVVLRSSLKNSLKSSFLDRNQFMKLAANSVQPWWRDPASLFFRREKKRAIPAPEAAPKAATSVEETSSKEKEIVVEEEKNEEVVVAAEVEKTPKTTPVKVEEAAPTEPPKACGVEGLVECDIDDL
uniref:Uncharacterized protein n=1 Tax=Lactuca sativa TaxID=4236 RepID=A0A9R1UTK6_LACSA|nr:hypothetical protein LSAT_V11C800401030 [Lactuca sativa]